jgi:hypothetical protein
VADDPEKEPTDPARRLRARHPLVYRIVVAILAVAPAFGAYFTAAGSARTEAQVVKDKAESGYQVTRDAVVELREANAELLERLVRIDAEVSALKRAVRSIGRKTSVAVTVTAPPPVPAPPPPPSPLPANLDRAAEQKPPPEAAR